jgi:uncharacterized membrane protein YphA (DoxX/SURF4 family)
VSISRPVAFLLSGEMAVAYFHGHAPHGFWPVLHQGTDAAFYAFLWLYISSAAGPGRGASTSGGARVDPAGPRSTHG